MFSRADLPPALSVVFPLFNALNMHTNQNEATTAKNKKPLFFFLNMINCSFALNGDHCARDSWLRFEMKQPKRKW